jgi:hypothetical protein
MARPVDRESIAERMVALVEAAKGGSNLETVANALDLPLAGLADTASLIIRAWVMAGADPSFLDADPELVTALLGEGFVIGVLFAAAVRETREADGA